MKAIYGYVRVSTNDQAENGLGLETKEERIRAFAKSQGWELTDIKIDSGISGAKIKKRDSLVKIIQNIKKGLVDKVIVYKLDRLSRSLRDLKILIDDVFIPHNTALVSVTEQLDTNTPQGRLFFNILGSFAEFERELIAERLEGGRKIKAKIGIKSQGSILGYDMKDKGIVVNKKEAELVDAIFKGYLSYGSLGKLKKAIDSTGRKNKKGSPFSKQSLHYILTNEFYIGNIRHGEIRATGTHKPIISKITFGKVQKSLERNRKAK